MTAIANPHRVTGAVAGARAELAEVAEVPVWAMTAEETTTTLAELQAIRSQAAELEARLLTHADGLDLAGWVQYGASPRATLALLRASKAHAFLAGRGYVTPEDVKRTAPDVLRHRVMISYEAEAEDKRPDEIVQRVLDHLPVP